MTTLDDKLRNAQTWDDLRDQLTDQQIAWFDRFEERAVGDRDELTACLLEEARMHARRNRVDAAVFGHMPVPAGAVKCWHWEESKDGTWERHFEGTSRTVEIPGTPKGDTINVDIGGFQHEDGSVERHVNVHAVSTELSADQVRQVSVALAEAADELERLG